MRWVNKGHEFDHAAREIINLFHNKRIYIFGAGQIGKEMKALLKKYNILSIFIDNDRRKQNSGVEGQKVISLDEYKADKTESIVILAADAKNIPVMKKQLHEIGLKKGTNYFIHTDFTERIFPILSVYQYDLLFIDIAQICLTERCSLKCKKCAHGCYAVDSISQDISMETVRKSADSFFEKVDIIREFVLIGGEPFLYEKLAEAIQYVGENYREKIVTFSITTNGTIVPQKRLLALCKKYDVLIRISNYSAALQWLEEKQAQILRKLDESEVSYNLGYKDILWMDYGFETVNRKWEKEKLKQVFDQCKTPCREIRGNRYYYCVMARSVSENLKFGLGEEDYLDLEQLRDGDKKILLEFQLGYSEKGYLDMCNHCNGADAVNYLIPAAEQI